MDISSQLFVLENRSMGMLALSKSDDADFTLSASSETIQVTIGPNLAHVEVPKGSVGVDPSELSQLVISSAAVLLFRIGIEGYASRLVATLPNDSQWFINANLSLDLGLCLASVSSWQKLLAIAECVSNQSTSDPSLLHIAQVYGMLALYSPECDTENERMTGFLQKLAMRLSKLPDPLDAGVAYYNLANFVKSKDPAAALEFLALAEQYDSRYRSREYFYGERAECFYRLGAFDKMAISYESAVEVAKESGSERPEGYYDVRLADSYLLSGEICKAYQTAIESRVSASGDENFRKVVISISSLIMEVTGTRVQKSSLASSFGEASDLSSMPLEKVLEEMASGVRGGVYNPDCWIRLMPGLSAEHQATALLLIGHFFQNSEAMAAAYIAFHALGLEEMSAAVGHMGLDLFDSEFFVIVSSGEIPESEAAAKALKMIASSNAVPTRPFTVRIHEQPE